MKIVAIGGGPAALYFGILMKEADPAHEITILERNRLDALRDLKRRLERDDNDKT